MSSLAQFKDESRALSRLASPIILSQIAQVLMGLVDTVMSGHAGAIEQAVVGLGVALWIPVFIGLMSVVQAVSPIIAHHFGAGDRDAVARDAREGIWLALCAGLVPLLLVPWAPDLLTMFRIDTALAERAGVFLWGIGLGLPAALVYRSLAFYSASINQTRPIMVIAFVGLGINAFLNWVLQPALECGLRWLRLSRGRPARRPTNPTISGSRGRCRVGPFRSGCCALDCRWEELASQRWQRSPAWRCWLAGSAKCRSPPIRSRSTFRHWFSWSRWGCRLPSRSASVTRWELGTRQRRATSRGLASPWA